MRSLMLCLLIACGDAPVAAPQEPAKVSDPSVVSDSVPTPERKCRTINAVIDGQIIYVPSPCAPSQVDVEGDPALDRGEADPRHDVINEINREDIHTSP